MSCQNCEGVIVYPQGLDGEKICKNCGLVIENAPSFKSYIEWTPEWHSNWNEDDSEALKEWLTTLRMVSCQLNIPNYPFREEAARTLRRKNHLLTKSQKLSKNKRATVAALIHLTLKEYNKMRPLKEISKELGLDARTLLKQNWLLNRVVNSQSEPLKNQRKTAFDYLHECAGKLTSDKQLILRAEAVLLKIRRSGGNPVGLAAGAFYNACKKKRAKISKEEIGLSFHISERTVYTNEARIRKLLASRIDVSQNNPFSSREANI